MALALIRAGGGREKGSGNLAREGAKDGEEKREVLAGLRQNWAAVEVGGMV